MSKAIEISRKRVSFNSRIVIFLLILPRHTAQRQQYKTSFCTSLLILGEKQCTIKDEGMIKWAFPRPPKHFNLHSRPIYGSYHYHPSAKFKLFEKAYVLRMMGSLANTTTPEQDPSIIEIHGSMLVFVENTTSVVDQNVEKLKPLILKGLGVYQIWEYQWMKGIDSFLDFLTMLA
ncbi:hypothetical protein BDA99DRAFT_536183 [Phascolomyces articulosus]|uniref:Uncharacterized protein n=1 Tax=Phascolomyces articulosus TaxID=60185 RepID=A0AAD5KHI1_9FUNG|nr:hypothetical protein BDA99DRAFT_536183 [Phascolomyces articulosus]